MLITRIFLSLKLKFYIRIPVPTTLVDIVHRGVTFALACADPFAGCSRNYRGVYVLPILSRVFAHAVISCLCAVGSAHTCRLLASPSQLILLANKRRLLSEWIYLLNSHFHLLSGHLLSLTNSSVCAKTNFPTRSQFLHFSSHFLLGSCLSSPDNCSRFSVLLNWCFIFCPRASALAGGRHSRPHGFARLWL